jgi:glycosyltransferase involved in cell wall biosynthesis
VALRGALELDPSRFETTILAGEGNRLVDEARARGLTVELVPELRSSISPAHDLRALDDLTDRLRYGRFDVVHTHSSKAGAIGRLAARRAQVPRVVHTFHGFPFHQFQTPWRRAAYVQIERQLGRITDAFLAVGPGVAAEAVRRRIAAPEQVRTIGVAVDTSAPPPEPRARAEARRLLGVPLGHQVIATVGRVDYQKAPEDFVDAIARLGDRAVHAVWIGDGPLRRTAQLRAERRGLDRRIAFVGERSDVPALLPGCDIFAMASRYEGLPCAIVEAMAVGLPVVATAVNSVPDLVVPGETGLLVPAERPDSLARALRHLLDHPAEAARLGAAGRAHLDDRLTPAALGVVLEMTYSPATDPGARVFGAGPPTPAPNGNGRAHGARTA